MPPLKRIFQALFLLGAASTAAADETPNYVRQSATFLTTGNIAAGNNPIDIFATEDDAFPTGISFAAFLELFQTAHAEGRGGVIDFDNPVYGDPVLDHDRTGVRAFIESQIRGRGFDSQTEAQAAIEAARALAYESGVVDFSVVEPVINRLDPSLDDPTQGPQGEDILFDETIGLFGAAGERRLVLRRGPQHYMEGDLASRGAPASEFLRTVNDSYYTHVERSTYGDGGRPGPLPVSLPFSRNGGITDLLIDARDNVTAVGFVLLSAGNFQYWQGLGAFPDNTDNMRVRVEFSDGSSDLLTSTTLDSSGGGDTFFGIRAPEGTSITRLKMRVIGRNWRTRTFLDDFAFITEPSPPFVASPLVSSGSVGAPFYYRLLTAQNPQEVTVEGLPTGLEFDSETGLISGVPSDTGDFKAFVTLTNEVGTTVDELLLRMGPTVSEEQLPRILAVPPISVTLGRDLAPASVVTSLDAEVLPGELEFFTLVRRLGDDGTRTLVTLETTGLGLSAGVFSGAPDRPAQVGAYEVDVFVRNEFGGDRATTLLNVFPIVPAPNIGGDEATDLVWLDSGGGTVHTLAARGNYLHPVTGFQVIPRWTAVDTGLSATASSFIGFGDPDSNNQTDILAHTPGKDHLDIVFFHEKMKTETLRFDDLDPTWAVVATGDYRGDSHTSLLWHQPETRHHAIWHIVNRDLRWAGGLFLDGLEREFVLQGDFDGDGTHDLLFRHAADTYELVNIRILTGTGTVDYASEVFSMPTADWVPHMTADLTGDGVDDLLWKNHHSGEVTAWIMAGVGVPESARASAETNATGEVIPALPGVTLLPFGSRFEVVLALDVDEDQRDDLILRHRETGGFYLLLMDGPERKAPLVPLPISGDAPRVVAAGDFNGNKREDLLVRDAADGTVRFKLMGADGIKETHSLGVFGDGIEFITPRAISNDLSPPPGRDDPVPPWEDARILGDRWFFLPGFGTFHDPPGGGWIRHTEHGVIGVKGSDPQNLWLIDYRLGWMWTGMDVYPWLYWPNPILNTWLYYHRGTTNPRWFYFQAIDLWITDEELLEYL